MSGEEAGTIAGQALILSAFAGLFLIGAWGAIVATRQSRAGHHGFALQVGVLAALALIVSTVVLVVAAAWLL